jgi:hypothetical protein
MHLLQIRDHPVLHLDDLVHLDVALHLDHHLMDLSCDMDLKKMVHLLHRDVVQNLDDLVHLLHRDVVRLDALQNLDVVRLDVVRLDELHPSDVVVDEELRHLLRMDYFLDAVDEELHYLQRKDCYQDVVQLAHLEPVELVQEQQVHRALLCKQPLQLMLPLPPHVMLSAPQDQHRALLQVQQRVLGLPQISLAQQLSLLQLS